MSSPYNTIVDADGAYAFVRRHFKLGRSKDQKGYCQYLNGQLVAAIVYDEFNGHNIWMHVAGLPGVPWVNKTLLRTAFHYPFVQLGAERISGWVEEDNLLARRFDEHLGFKVDAVLPRAGAKGQDVIIYRMFREDCKYA